MRFLRNRIWVPTQVCIWAVAVAGCSSEDGSGNGGGATPSLPAVTTGGAGGSGAGAPAQPGQEGSGLTGTGVAPRDPAPGAAGMPAASPISGTGNPPQGQPPPADPVAPPADPVAPPADPVARPADPVAPPADPVAPPADPVTPPDNGAGAAGAGGPASPDPIPPSQDAGPQDGDPSRPIVQVPGVACGPNPSLFGLTATNVQIGGRDVYVAYPCNKHGGAPVTFVLNLHGTMPTEELKLYQVAYFSINNHVDTHNIITAAPKSVVAQWGNGDGGVDLPHLYEVIDWVYSNFSEFDIRSMWVGGHSWGSMTTNTFVCDPMVADRVRGAILMSGSPIPPACASGLSIISTIAENDLVPTPVNQGTIPTSHGCGASVENMVGNNLETHWPNCDPGFAHANYYMYGKAHADYIDAVVVERIADLINAARP